MAEIQLKKLTKRWGNFTAVDDFNLTIADKEFLVLLGPSGCGKTTTCLLYTSPSPRDAHESRMPSSA